MMFAPIVHGSKLKNSFPLFSYVYLLDFFIETATVCCLTRTQRPVATATIYTQQQLMVMWSVFKIEFLLLGKYDL